MSITVKVARDPIELDSLFRTRHTVFVEEEGYFPPTPSQRIVDQFDAYPTTANVIAKVGERVVGGFRVTENSPGGIPASELFDFSSYLPAPPVKTAGAGMLCLLRQYRDVPRLCLMMLCMANYWALSRRISHIAVPMNPKEEHIACAIGCQRVAPPFHDGTHGIDVVPMILDMSALKDPFLDTARKQGLHAYLETFERQLFSQGETIVDHGAPAHAAYVLIDGRVSIRNPLGQVVARLGAGALFGELALLTARPRGATVVADSNVDVMVIDRETFHRQLRENTDLQARLLELVATRLVDTLEQASQG